VIRFTSVAWLRNYYLAHWHVFMAYQVSYLTPYGAKDLLAVSDFCEPISGCLGYSFRFFSFLKEVWHVMKNFLQVSKKISKSACNCGKQIKGVFLVFRPLYKKCMVYIRFMRVEYCSI
jgi:hypothetical protein